MNASDSFVAQLEDYLEHHEGTTPLPDAVRDAVRAEVAVTRQLRARTPWSMMMTLPRAIAYAAVALLTLIIVATSISLPRLGGPASQATPNPSPVPTASATLTPRPVPLTALSMNTPYYLTLGTGASQRRLDFIIPQVWAQDGWHIVHSEPNMMILGTPDGSKSVGLAIVQNIYRNPCLWTGGTASPTIGTDYRSVVDALRHELGPLDPLWGTAQATSIVQEAAGILGVKWDVTLPADQSACDGGVIRGWTTASGDGPALSGDVTFFVQPVYGTTILIWAAMDIESNVFHMFWRSMQWSVPAN